MSFERAPYTFHGTRTAEPPERWRALFRGHFADELRCDARMPARIAAFGLDERPAITSWILGRLARLLGAGSSWCCVDGPEIRIDLEVRESGRSIADLRLLLASSDARLVDLDGPIAARFRDALLDRPEDLAEIRVRVAPDLELGFAAGELLGRGPPEQDVAWSLERILSGEDVPRLDDDREERCPISRQAVLDDWIACSPRPPRRAPRIQYIQSLSLNGEPAWLFRVTASRRKVHAVVRLSSGTPVVEWWG